MTAAAAEDRDRVGPYRVLQAIGAGGSARIDLARIDRAYGFQRHVVLKRPLEHLRGDRSVAASLRREARIGGRLRHPNLVAILDAGVHDDYDYLVLEYVHGAALRGVMQTDAPGRVRELPLGVALAIVAEVAHGMHAAHELTDEHGAPLGLVHRDISPGNILLGLDGTVKLADFGIAKETRVSTLSGSMHGTVTYMAPEQCQGHAFDRRADVFSLGVILYELVTGARLFWADNDVASLHRVLSGAVPPPRSVAPQVSAALEDIVMTAVAHDAVRRFATARDLAAAIEHYAASAGEVLGARWVSRAVKAVVGARPVPWLAAPALPEPGLALALAADGSLVELIAALSADEPAAPPFGDDGEPTEQHDLAELIAPAHRPSAAGPAAPPDARADTAPAASEPPPSPDAPAASTTLRMSGAPAPSSAPSAPSVRSDARELAITAALEAPPTARRASRQLWRPVIAIVAFGAIAGSAVTAALMMRSSTTPASSSPSQMAAPASSGPTSAGAPASAAAAAATGASPPITADTPAPTIADPPSATPGTPPDAPGSPTAAGSAAAASARPIASDSPTDDPANAAPRKPTAAPLASTSPPTASHAIKHKPRPASRAQRDAASAASTETAATGTAAAAPPANAPAAKVEWKPTLLLPSDGANPKAHK